MNRLPALFCAPMVLLLGAAVGIGQTLPVSAFRSDHGDAASIGVPLSSTPKVDPDRPNVANLNARVTQVKKLPYGNLKPLKVSVEKSGFTLNGVDLEPIKLESARLVSIDLATAKKIKVRLHFWPTMRMTNGRARLKSREADLNEYRKNFPKIAEVLEYQDAIAAFKPVTFELRNGAENVELLEETFLVFSSNPDDIPKMRKVILHEQGTLLSTNKLAAQPMDVQYRGLPHPAAELDFQGTLQMLYVRVGRQAIPQVLGVFLICSRPSGDFEYYKLPAGRLDAILDPEDALIAPDAALASVGP